jgi:ELWxxDGT repeat protein
MRTRLCSLSGLLCLLLYSQLATAQKPRLLKDIYPGFTLLRPPYALPDESVPRELIPLNNKVIFIATEGVLVNGETSNRTALWVTDATENGTQRIMFWPEGQWERRLINKSVINGILYFYLYYLDDAKRVYIFQLWRSDGTTAGTTSIRTFEISIFNSLPISTFHELNDQNYFVVDKELWRTNGTVAGTEKVVSEKDFPRGFSIDRLTVLNNVLYSMNGGDLHKSNGTKESITRITGTNFGPPNSTIMHVRAMDNSIYVITKQLLTDKEVLSLWRTDGTPNGIRQLVVLDDSPVVQSLPITLRYKTNIREVLATDKKIYYTLQRDSALPQELWVTDGTAQGTLKLTDLHKYSLFNENLGLVNLNNKVFFIKEISSGVLEFWTSDGTVTGTKRLPIVSGEFLDEDYVYFKSNPKQVKLYIPQKGLAVNSIYETDGTEAGTRLLFNATQYTPAQKLGIDYFGNRILRVGNKLIFGAEEYEGDGFTYDSKTGTELYVLDLPCTPPARPSITGSNVVCNGVSERYRLSGPKQGETYKWTVQGGRIVTNNDSTITVQWQENGQRTVAVSVTNDCTSSTATLGVFVKAGVPTASVNIAATGSLTLLSDATVTLSVPNVPSQTYQWLRNGISIPGATNSRYEASMTGEYSIIIAQDGCSTTSLPVRVVSAFQAIVSGSTQVCSGQSTTLTVNVANGTPPFRYEWRQGNLVLPATGSTLIVTQAGSYSVTVTDSQSAVAASNVFAVAVRPLPDATISTTGQLPLQPGRSAVLSVAAVAGQTYLWQRDGQTISGAATNTLTVTQAGNYVVTVTRDGCSAASAPVRITLMAVLQASVLGPTQFCEGLTALLSVTVTGGQAPYTYQWQRDGVAIGANSATLVVTQAGSYSVTVTDSQSAVVRSAGVNVTQTPRPAPIITVAGPTQLAPGTSVVLSTSISPGQTYLWQRDGQSIATGRSVTATQAGSYVLVQVALNGCLGMSAPVVISIVLATEPTVPGFELTVSPNPTSGLLRATLTLDSPAPATLRLFDAAGRQVRMQAFGAAQRTHAHTFDLSNVPGGVLYLRAEVGYKQLTQKIVKE